MSDTLHYFGSEFGLFGFDEQGQVLDHSQHRLLFVEDLPFEDLEHLVQLIQIGCFQVGVFCGIQFKGMCLRLLPDFLNNQIELMLMSFFFWVGKRNAIHRVYLVLTISYDLSVPNQRSQLFPDPKNNPLGPFLRHYAFHSLFQTLLESLEVLLPDMTPHDHLYRHFFVLLLRLIQLQIVLVNLLVLILQLLPLGLVAKNQLPFICPVEYLDDIIQFDETLEVFPVLGQMFPSLFVHFIVQIPYLLDLLGCQEYGWVESVAFHRRQGVYSGKHLLSIFLVRGGYFTLVLLALGVLRVLLVFLALYWVALFEIIACEKRVAARKLREQL